MPEVRTTLTEAEEDALYMGVAVSKVFEKGNRIRDGKYTFAVIEHKTAKAKRGPSWIAKFRVLTAEPIPGVYAAGGEPCWPDTPGAMPVEPNAPGTECDFVCVVGSSDAVEGNIKQYVLALGGYSETQFAQMSIIAAGKRAQEQAQGLSGAQLTPDPLAQFMRQLANNDPKKFNGAVQPMKGAVIRCETRSAATKGGPNVGKRGCYPNFAHIAHQNPDPALCAKLFAERAERRRLIEGGLPIPWPTPVTDAQIAVELEAIQAKIAARAAAQAAAPAG